MEVLKIIFCEMEKKNQERFKSVLMQQGMKFKTIETEEDYLSEMIKEFEPDAVLTDHTFWEKENGITILKQLRQLYDIPFIIWEMHANPKIMSAVFNVTNTNFIKSTEDEIKLIEAMRKLKAGVMTNY